MDYAEMVGRLKKSGEDIIAGWTPLHASRAHMLTGIYDEYMEVTEALILLDGVKVDLDNTVELAKELGDLMFYLVGLAQDYHIEAQVLAYPLPEPSRDALQSMITATTMVKRHLYYNKPLDTLELAVALRKLIANVASLAAGTGRSLEDILDLNQGKLLGGRYKEGKFSDEQANDREDETLDT